MKALTLAQRAALDCLAEAFDTITETDNYGCMLRPMQACVSIRDSEMCEICCELAGKNVSEMAEILKPEPNHGDGRYVGRTGG